MAVNVNRIMQQARAAHGAGAPMMTPEEQMIYGAAGIPIGAGMLYGGHRLHKWMDKQPLFGEELRDLADRFVATGKLPALNRAPEYAELGAEIAQAPVLQPKGGPILGGEFIEGLREGLPGRLAGAKPLTGPYKEHYTEFAKGPREAYAQLGRETFEGGFGEAFQRDIIESLNEMDTAKARAALPGAAEDDVRRLLSAALEKRWGGEEIPETVAELLERIPKDKSIASAMYETSDPLIQYANLKMAPRISRIAEDYGRAFDVLKGTRAPLRGLGTGLKALGVGGLGLGTLMGIHGLTQRGEPR